jgi:hypothetical protein
MGRGRGAGRKEKGEREGCGAEVGGVGEFDRGEADVWPTSGWLGWRRNMKDDECGRCKYKGENMSEWN